MLAHVSVARDWTLVFHEHLKRAAGKAAVPNNLQASETHLLMCALQVLIICCPLLCTKPVVVQLCSSMHSMSEVRCPMLFKRSLSVSSMVISQIAFEDAVLKYWRG